MKITIKHRYHGNTLFEHEVEDNTMLKTVKAALAAGTVITSANLRVADLSNADLRNVNLSGGCLG